MIETPWRSVCAPHIFLSAGPLWREAVTASTSYRGHCGSYSPAAVRLAARLTQLVALQGCHDRQQQLGSAARPPEALDTSTKPPIILCPRITRSKSSTFDPELVVEPSVHSGQLQSYRPTVQVPLLKRRLTD